MDVVAFEDQLFYLFCSAAQTLMARLLTKPLGQSALTVMAQKSRHLTDYLWAIKLQQEILSSGSPPRLGWLESPRREARSKSVLN